LKAGNKMVKGNIEKEKTIEKCFFYWAISILLILVVYETLNYFSKSPIIFFEITNLQNLINCEQVIPTYLGLAHFIAASSLLAIFLPFYFFNNKKGDWFI